MKGIITLHCIITTETELHCIFLIPLSFFPQGKAVRENVAGGVLIGNRTLVLQDVGRRQAGLYTCVASNAEGDGESNAQYLNIKCESVIGETCHCAEMSLHLACF